MPLPFIILKIYNFKITKILLEKICSKTIHKDILDDVIDYQKRTIMTLYLKDSGIFYRGIFKAREEKGSDSYITLINYISRNNENDLLIDATEIKTSVLINLRDVERIEMFYENDSEVWGWLNSDNKKKSK